MIESLSPDGIVTARKHKINISELRVHILGTVAETCKGLLFIHFLYLVNYAGSYAESSPREVYSHMTKTHVAFRQPSTCKSNRTTGKSGPSFILYLSLLYVFRFYQSAFAPFRLDHLLLTSFLIIA